jgi:photosystem II stability/assembly factor-like uncharacterized protein
MHKFLFTFLFLSLISTSVYSQWQPLHPRPSGSTTYMGAAPSADKYIVGSNFLSEAIMTTDGGQTWSIKPLPTSSQVRSTYFINDNLGWIGGAGSALFKTTNGGADWVHVPAIDTVKYDIHFVNENIGWSTGFRGFIMRTVDGGTNWESRSITHLTTSTLYGIFAVDSSTVYAAGSGNSLYRTTDAGETWTLMTSPFGTSTDFKEVKFLSRTVGYVVGGGTRIAKTTDAGSTWSSVNSGASVQLWSLSFNNSGNIGLASGASSTLLRSTNGGDSWTPITGFPASLTFYSVRFGSDNVAYLSGSNGYYFKSTDGGATWTDISYHFTTTRLRDVSFANNDTGYIVGTTFIAKTTDGGYSWVQQTSPFTGDINEVVAATTELVIGGCDAGNIVRTTNGGANWTQVATGITGSNTDILAIDFMPNGYGIVVGYNGGSGISVDGGLTWKAGGSIASTSVWDMHMVDENYAWCVDASGRIFRTVDGGAVWELQFDAPEALYGVSFMNRSVGIAGGSGGAVYYTTDGGTTWTPAETTLSNTIWGIHITESPVYGSVALQATASGYLNRSIDGGKNWIADGRVAISTMDDVTMTDAAHAWIVGSSGAIVGYYDPSNIPVEMKSFTASASANSVTLHWSTATEVNNKGFELEKYNISESEKNGTDVWSKIAFIDGKGTSSEPSSYSYTDKNLVSGVYNYRLKQIDFDGTYKYYMLNESVEVGSPGKFELSQNYPNPFNPSTKIKFSIPSDGFVTLKVYNSLGEEAAHLMSGDLKTGYYETEFNSTGLSSGVYYYKLTAGSYSETKKMILIK